MGCAMCKCGLRHEIWKKTRISAGRKYPIMQEPHFLVVSSPSQWSLSWYFGISLPLNCNHRFCRFAYVLIWFNFYVWSAVCYGAHENELSWLCVCTTEDKNRVDVLAVDHIHTHTFVVIHQSQWFRIIKCMRFVCSECGVCIEPASSFLFAAYANRI